MTYQFIPLVSPPRPGDGRPGCFVCEEPLPSRPCAALMQGQRYDQLFIVCSEQCQSQAVREAESQGRECRPLTAAELRHWLNRAGSPLRCVEGRSVAGGLVLRVIHVDLGWTER